MTHKYGHRVTQLIRDKREAVRLSRQKEYREARALDAAARFAQAAAKLQQPKQELRKAKTMPVPPSNAMRRG